jgi:hypothetical protein
MVLNNKVDPEEITFEREQREKSLTMPKNKSKIPHVQSSGNLIVNASSDQELVEKSTEIR